MTDALAMAGKGGLVATGFTKTEQALAHSKVVALVHAAGAAPDGTRKLDAAWRRERGGQPSNAIEFLTSAQLDLALGRPNVIHAALLAGPVSETFLERCRRLERFRTGDQHNRTGQATPNSSGQGRDAYDRTNKNAGEKLSVTPTKTLTLKRSGVEQGVVRQSFSHGRSKAVVVEKVKRRIGPGEPRQEAAPAPERAPLRRSACQPRRRACRESPGRADSRPVFGLRTCARSRPASCCARSPTKSGAPAHMRSPTRACARRKNERSPKKKRASARPARKPSAPSARLPKRASARKKSAAPRTRRPNTRPTKSPRSGSAPTLRLRKQSPALPARCSKLKKKKRRGPRAVAPAARRARPAPAPKAPKGNEKRRGRLTVVTALSADEVRERSVASFRRRVQRITGHRDAEPKEKIAREVTVPETITIQELANRMAERSVDVVRILMQQGHMAKITDTIDADTAQLIAEELGHTVRRVAESDVEEGMFDAPDDPATLLPRAPVVTIMGHVDHGKTSLLDAIRSTDVAAAEAGGITQHIGAYQVTSPSGGRITFVDTPGHAAFTAMRARGAKITDIVVLVVAADDGVMPQTIEAIHHAKAAKVPIIVAINKIDKADARPDRVRTELLQHEIQVELLGGDVLEIEVSAKAKTNLDKLLDMIALQAEVLELRANPNRPAEGTVIEARLDRGRGPVATVLVQRGTLRPGDIVVAGSEWGRVRALMSDTGHAVVAAGPSMPVEVLGFNGTPEASDRLAAVGTEARAREIADYRARQKRDIQAARQTGMRGSLEQMMSQLKTRAARISR